MSQLNLSCLGTFQATLNGTPLTNFHSAKVQALLAYLAIEADRPHTRETLMALLWPDDATQSAQQSLRQALYALRRVLGDTDNSVDEPFLLVTRQTVQFNPAAAYTLDVATFLQQKQQGNLAQAVALYPADLLVGLTSDSAAFEEWLRATREYLHNLALNALDQLTQQRLAASDYTGAVTYARRQLSLEPWREEAHRQVMMALALSGERSAALAQYESCRRVLADELGVEPAAETMSLYTQIRAGELAGQRVQSLSTQSGEALLLSVSTPAHRHNLPSQPTAFIGRQTDLAQITARLDDPTCRLLTIVGPGGMGKTRLAIQAAQRIWEATVTLDDMLLPKRQPPTFVDGVFFVALAGVGSPDLLVSTFANALDFTFYGSGDPKTQLLDYLHTKAILLVLDNCEHLLDGIDLVSDLLAAAPNVKMLATSREPLNLREEWLHPLSGMSFPTDEIATAPLDNYTAVQLFVQCARQMKPTFDLTTEGIEVVHICQLVEGMPLGIELAATWLKFYSCAQIAREVVRNLDFLTTKLRNVVPRHRSMRAVFEHSWSLLTIEEQQVLCRMAVFHGGCTLEAAIQVTGATLPLMLTLVEKSLLQLTPDRRLQFHELLRQFAADKLHADPAEEERVQDVHCHYYCTWLGQQEGHLKGSAHLRTKLAIEREIENVRAAWAHGIAREYLDELEQALESLSYFHDIQCWYEQGMQLFQRAAEILAPYQTRDRHRLLFARILIKQAEMQGTIASELGRDALREPTKTLLTQAFTVLQDYKETLAYGDALRLQSGFRSSEDYQQWASPCLKAITIFEKHHDYWRIARTLVGLGFRANRSGRYARAIQYFERGIALCEQIGDQYTLGDILDNYGETRRALGEYEEAMRLAQAGLVARNAVSDKRGIAFTLYLLGDLAWRLGNLEAALRYSRQSVAIFTELGIIYGLDAARHNLGNIARMLGDLAEAHRQFALILQPKLESNTLEASNLVPWALTGMAEVLCQEGRIAQAIELVEQVLRHPNNWQEYKERALKLRSELAAPLSPEAMAAAQARGQIQPLSATVRELLAERNSGML